MVGGCATEARPEEIPLPTIFTAVLSGVGAASERITGEIVVLSNGPGEPLQLGISGDGFTPGDHAWHIHTGPCETSGGAVEIALSKDGDREGIVGPLVVEQTGAVSGQYEVAPLREEMLGTRERSLHVHETHGDDHGPTVACATI